MAAVMQHSDTRYKNGSLFIIGTSIRYPRVPLYPDLSNISCLIFHGTSYHIRFSSTRYSVTRRGFEDSSGEIRTPFFVYTSSVWVETLGQLGKVYEKELQQTCIVSKRIRAWMRRRFPNFGPPRPKCPSIARMLTIFGGVTSDCSDH